MVQYRILFNGRSKQVCEADSDDRVILHFKDNTSAYNDIKKAVIEGKGAACCKVSSYIFNYLNMNGVETHFIARQSETDQLCRRVSIIPVEFEVRNYIAGSLSHRLKIQEGQKSDNLIVEMSYRNRELGNPYIGEDIAVALKLATYEELHEIRNTIEKINELLVELFSKAGIKLIDFKAFFGRTHYGRLVLANEISPDTCRLWDAKTDESLDKDRFRKDLDNVASSYQQVFERLNSLSL